MEDIKALFENYLNEYNQAWYSKDIDRLSNFYDIENNNLIYFDNHKGNDTYTLKEHLSLISEFFKHGKQTESGEVEELIIENFNVFARDESACFCFIARYKSCPNPYVRMTMYLEKFQEMWKVMHVHCSFEPEN